MPKKTEIDDEVLADEIFNEQMNSMFDKIKQERDEYKNKYLYAVADKENTAKRLKSQMNLMSENAKTDTVKEFLVICDNFKFALSFNEHCDDPTVLKEGFVSLYNEFMNVLSKLNIMPMKNVVGSEFTTDLYEAVSMKDCGSDKSGKVVECLSDGYFIGDNILRHAKVVVGK